MEKILQEMKFAERKLEFLKDFVVWALQKQNEYLKINDKVEVELMNITIQKTLDDIAKIQKIIEELYQDLQGLK